MNQIEYQKKIIREEYIQENQKENKNEVRGSNLRIPTKKNRSVLVQK